MRETSALVHVIAWNQGFLDLLRSHPVSLSRVDFSDVFHLRSTLRSINSFTAFL